MGALRTIEKYERAAHRFCFNITSRLGISTRSYGYLAGSATVKTRLGIRTVTLRCRSRAAHVLRHHRGASRSETT